MLLRAIKEAYWRAVVIPKAHSFYSTINDMLQKQIHKKRANENKVPECSTHCCYLSIKHINPDKFHDSLKLLNLRPGPYILMHKEEIINICHVPRDFVSRMKKKKHLVC
jgi:hypothetical protein